MRLRKPIKLEKGTITLAFPFKEGIMIGVDSRITRKQTIVSDKKQKFFEISCNIFCTMMGRVHVWENMALYVQQKVKSEERLRCAPATVSYAAEKALEHLEYEFSDYEYMEDEEELIFGTIIAGWQKTTGFELYNVNLDGNRAWKTDRKSSTILGSGAKYAQDVMDSVVYHVHENGYQEKRSLDALEVYSRYYNIYDLYTYEPKTFFLLYSTDYQPIAGNDLINLGSDEGLVAAHLVAKKRDFNIHRLVFNSIRSYC
ncbi:hypothetical protein ABKV19_006134 [Rosa sericea]